MADGTIQIEVQAKDNASGILNRIGGSLGSIGQIMGGITAAGIADKLWDSLINGAKQALTYTISYADQVRNLARITGESAEETSRLIQVADDAKVSYEQLGTAMKFAARQGIDTTTESLAALSDEYLQLAAGQERAAFLMEKFGRSGLVMAELMEQGSAAIRAQAAAVSDGLILSQQQVDAARELQRAQDELNDSYAALQNTIGTQTIPVLTELVQYLNRSAEAWVYIGESLADFNNELANSLSGWQRFIPYVALFRSLVGVDNVIQDGVNDTADALGRFGQMAEAAAAPTAELAMSIEDLSAVNLDFVNKVQSAQSVWETYTDGQRDLEGQIAAVNDALLLADKQGYTETSEKVKGLTKELEGLQSQVQESIQAFNQAQNEMVLDIVFESLKSGTEGFTDAEREAFLQVGKDMGIFSDQAVKMVQDAMTKAQGYLDDIDAAKPTLELEVVLTGQYEEALMLAGLGGYVSTPTGMAGGGGNAGAINMQAGGGPLGLGANLVGENGPELVIGNYVLPSDVTRQIMASAGAAFRPTSTPYPGGERSIGGVDSGNMSPAGAGNNYFYGPVTIVAGESGVSEYEEGL